MVGVSWSEQEDALLIELDKAGFDAHEIAERLPGRTDRAILHRREKLNLPKRSFADVGKLQSARWIREFEDRLGEPIAAWLNRRYVTDGASYRELTKEAGINTRTLMKMLKLCNVEPISPKEAHRRQLEKDPALHERIRVAGATKEAIAKRALWRERNWNTFCSKGELRFLKVLKSADLIAVPQLAVEGFNIDFAFPDVMLAVEYDPRWHRSASKRAGDKKKNERLAELGWTILRLDDRTSDETNVSKVSAALSKLASTHPR